MGGRECNLLRAGKLASKEEAQDSHGGPEGGGRAERPHPSLHVSGLVYFRSPLKIKKTILVQMEMLKLQHYSIR